MASDSSPQNKCVDVACSLIGVHGLQVRDVSNDVVLVDDAVAAQHVSCISCNSERLSTVVTFDDADHFRSHKLFVLELRDLVHSMQSQGDFRQHVSHLELW